MTACIIVLYCKIKVLLHWKLYKDAYILQESFAMTDKSYPPPCRNYLQPFLARLHFSAEELLLYPRRQRRRPCRRPRPHAKMLGQMLKSWNLSLSVFFLHLNLAYHTNKAPLQQKAYDRRASGDCGTSGTYL